MSDKRTLISYVYPPFASNTRKTKREFKGSPAAFRRNLPLEKYKGSDAMGYGIERCLYEFNPDISCLSPHLIHAAVLTPQEALLALEALAQEKSRPLSPIDRHLAAFLVSRWKGVSITDLRNLEKPQRETRNLAALRILSNLQKHCNVKELPHLCQWMADLCAPLVERYHNRKVRIKTSVDVKTAVASGQLDQLLTLFNNQADLAQDAEDFQMAKIEMLLVESEIKEIEDRIQNYNAIKNHKVTLWEKVKASFMNFKRARSLQKNITRKDQLHDKQKILHGTWDEIITFEHDDAYSEFWDDLWHKMNSAELTLPSSEELDLSPKK